MVAFERWEPIYEAVLADFGYDRAADRVARDQLAELLAGADCHQPAPTDFAGQTVAVVGGGPMSEDDSDLAAAADVVIATGAAVHALPAAGVDPDWVVSDLDGHADALVDLTAEGVRVVIHAHGDNQALLSEYVPRLQPTAVVPSTQAAPSPPVRNFGGFTDGDRAAFFADELGAGELVFPGWDVADDSVSTEKRAKLQWAARLLRWLEGVRGERFAVLDGRRDDLAPVPTADRDP